MTAEKTSIRNAFTWGEITEKGRTKNLADWIIWGMIAGFGLLYVSLIFNNNVWTDEIFSMELFRENLRVIVEGTAADVHPPLYYFLGRIIYLAAGNSLQAQKVLTILPMLLTLTLGAMKARTYFGRKTAFFFVLFLGCIPCTMEYAVQVRMYSWSLLCVTACGLAAWEIYQKSERKNYVLFLIAGTAAAYLHYFALVSVLVIGVLLLGVMWIGKKKLPALLLTFTGMVLLYLPWLPHMLKQVRRVEGGYWIPPITFETVKDYFVWAFGVELFPAAKWLFLFLAIVCVIRLLVLFITGKGQKQTVCYALLCMAVPVLTAAGGILVSLIAQPVYRDQYVLPAMGLFAFSVAVAVPRMGKVAKVVIPFTLVLCLAVGALQYREVFKQEYRDSLLSETEAFFAQELGANDMIVYNYQAYQMNYEYYFPEHRLAYVRDVDLNQDFDCIWFLDTEHEWDFVIEQIEPYGLVIEYIGHYGVEYNDFDLYKVTKTKEAATV